MAAPTNAEYSADSIELLEGLEAVRRRPGMYIGGTGEAGFNHLFFEIFDNCVDEVTGGYADQIDVVCHADGSYEIRDNGRGIPVDKHSKGVSALEVTFTELHAGGKFGGGAYTASGGLHGVGASVVNALSTRVITDVDREGKTHRLCFLNQAAGQFKDPEAGTGFRAGSKLKVLGKSAKGHTGTTVRYWPDFSIFDEGSSTSLEIIEERARRSCFLQPGLTVNIEDRRSEDLQTRSFCFEGGLLDYIEDVRTFDQVTETLSFVTDTAFEEQVSIEGKLKTIEREVIIEVAALWQNNFDPAVSSFVNIIPTKDGGTHQLGFERALVRALNETLIDGTPKLSKYKDKGKLTLQDATEGLVAVVRVQFDEPQFRGQTKHELGTPDIQKLVFDATKAALSDWVLKKAKKSDVKNLTNKLTGAIETRNKQLAAREESRASKKLSSLTAVPSKLADSVEHGPGTELLIVEGDSAAGPAKQGRDSRTQAVLPIRGKILNATKANAKQILENVEITQLTASLGAGSGANFDLDACRFERVIMLVDADVDGAHIRCLLLALFWKLYRPFVEAGRLYSAMAPLYTLAEITSKKDRRKWFALDADERDALLTDLEKQGVKVKVSRNKGLGEMNIDELAVTTLEPETRVLRRVTPESAEAANAAIELMMGKEIPPRRDFITSSAAFVDREALG